MKNMILKSTTLVLSLVVALASIEAFAAPTQTKKRGQINVSEDVDTLGGNEELMKMAQSLKSRTSARIVQERIVNRRDRLEFALSSGGVLGGDSYLKTQSVNGLVNYHINPRWSVGVQYSDFSNDLTPEGKRVLKDYRDARAANGTAAFAFDIDYPISSTMAVLNWYPIYGKTSYMDKGVTQFDMYLIAAAGQIELSSGSTGIFAGGIGVGAWLAQHLSLRAEIKYQSYKDQPITGSRTLGTGMANIGIGWIL